MDHTIEQFLKSIQDRGDLLGSCSAAAFIKSLHDASPRAIVLALASDERWLKELEDAGTRACWSDVGQEILEKSLHDGAGLTAGAILEYDAVLSTRQRDRDGDILEPKGITVDPAMPLLWQHLQLQPIGKHVRQLSQDENSLVCKFAIADVPLGRDAATLVRFGALRKSHGFKPVQGQFEPIEILKNAAGQPILNQQGQQIVRGWHVKQANTFEGSLVSIPSNAGGQVTRVYEKQFDGLATAYSRDLLKTDVVKHWAKSIYDLRPASAPGVTLTTGAAEPAPAPIQDPAGLTTKAGRAISSANETKLRAALESLKAILNDAGLDETEADKLAAGITSGVDVVLSGGKAFTALATKSLALVTKSAWDDNGDLLPGSYEHLSGKLSEQAQRYLLAKEAITSRDGYVRTLATFPTDAIVCVRTYDDGKYETSCYRIPYTLGDDGMPKFTGEPVEVEIKPQIIEKALAALSTKQHEPAPAPDTLTILSRKFAGLLMQSDGLGGEAGQAVQTIEKAVATVRQSSDHDSLQSLFNN